MRRRSFLALASAAGLGWAGPDRRGQGWLILDFDAVSCGVCFEVVPAFLRAVPEAVQEEALTAVLAFTEQPAAGSGRGRRPLVEAKWSGLCRVHGWKLPAVLDAGPGFRGLLGGRTARLVLFDRPGRRVRAFDLPLAPVDLDYALSLLLQ